MKTQTSWRNPPATNHRRPDVPKFWIWQDMHMRYDDDFARRHGWERHPWRWLCTFCDPPARGFRVKQGAFGKILNVSMPNHFSRRRSHHRYVARQRGLLAR